MNLSKIHHIAIIVSDYEAAKNFYVKLPDKNNHLFYKQEEDYNNIQIGLLRTKI